MGGHRSPGLAAVFSFDDGTKFFQGHAPLPYLQQGTDDGPHHIAQETVRLDAKHQKPVLLKPIRFHDFAVVGLHLGMHFRETRKVLILKEDIGCFLHLGKVKVTVKEISIVGMEWVFRARDVIMIRARNGIKTGMHLRCDLPNPINHDILGEEGIHLMGKHFRLFNFFLKVEMSVVVSCMDARIGAATARDGDWLSQLQAQAFLHRFLHALRVRLDLIAVVAAAIVGHVDEISWHRLD